MNKTLNAKSLPWLAILISGGLLCGAWFFQYVLGYPPCQMCYWQRDAHKIVLAVAVVAIATSYFGKLSPRLWAGLIALAFLGSVAMAFWHIGVEYKWWEGPKTCLSGTPKISDISSGADLLSGLNDPVKLPGCSEPAWHFLGLSMAGWNFLISLGGAAMAGLAALRKTPT